MGCKTLSFTVLGMLLLGLLLVLIILYKPQRGALQPTAPRKKLQRRWSK